jgi:hypothetical protein
MEKLTLLDVGALAEVIEKNADNMLDIQTDIAATEEYLKQKGIYSLAQIACFRERTEQLKRSYNASRRRIQRFAARLAEIPIYITTDIIHKIVEKIEIDNSDSFTLAVEDYIIDVDYACKTQGYREKSTNAYIVEGVSLDIDIVFHDGNDVELETIPSRQQIMSEIINQINQNLRQ